MGYEPPPEFEQNAKDPLVQLELTHSSQLWLIQWPLNQPPDFDGQQVTLKLHHDGHLGNFQASSAGLEEQVLDGIAMITDLISNKDTLRYQVPPLISNKTAVVISPLISLMQDQVMTLKQRGIRAEYLSSAQIDSTIQSNAESGKFDILYMTPEKMQMDPFEDINMAVDSEQHERSASEKEPSNCSNTYLSPLFAHVHIYNN